MASLNQSQSKQAYRDYITVSGLFVDFYIESGRERGIDGRLALFIELEGRLRDEARLAGQRVESSRSRDKMLWLSRIDERTDFAEALVEAAYEQQDEDSSNPDEEDGDDARRREAEAFGTDIQTWLDFLDLEINWSISGKAKDGERFRAYSRLEDVMDDTGHYSSAVEHVRYDGRFYWLVVGESSRSKRSTRAED